MGCIGVLDQVENRHVLAVLGAARVVRIVAWLMAVMAACAVKCCPRLRIHHLVPPKIARGGMNMRLY